MSLTISQNGINLIKQFEGCRLSAYRDAVGVITIGYGWTKPIDGVPLHMGMTITQAKAESLLRQGLQSYINNVNKFKLKDFLQEEYHTVSFRFFLCLSYLPGLL